MAHVIIYSTPTCGYCDLAKQFFKDNNISYTEKNVAADAAAREEMLQKTGQMGVPVIDIDGHISVGFQKAKVSQLLGVAA